MLSPAEQAKKTNRAIFGCRHGVTSTSHAKIKKNLQNHNWV
ncbi:hypothetical protein HMPREF0880_04515 [Yokenella regensburgei ATCC 43003]|nr:hypothetical protein HMPREF0880_04515 [Yokenella regensburgei ATCC 43003]